MQLQIFARKTILFFTVLLFSTLILNAQLKSVTVVTDKGTTTITNASIKVKSSRGYILGSEYQNFGGLYVTDTIILSEGIELKRDFIRWNSLKEVEFLEWSAKIGSQKYVTKGKLTFQDGSSRMIFLWNPLNYDTYTQIYPSEFRVEGKLSVRGKDQDVQVRGIGIRRLILEQSNTEAQEDEKKFDSVVVDSIHKLLPLLTKAPSLSSPTILKPAMVWNLYSRDIPGELSIYKIRQAFSREESLLYRDRNKLGTLILTSVHKEPDDGTYSNGQKTFKVKYTTYFVEWPTCRMVGQTTFLSKPPSSIDFYATMWEIHQRQFYKWLASL